MYCRYIIECYIFEIEKIIYQHMSMSRVLKILLSKPIKIIAIAIVVTAIVTRFATHFMEGDKYRQLIINDFQKATGLSLSIGGPISLNSTPIMDLIEITIPETKLSNLQDDKNSTLLQAKKINVHASLIDFFMGKISFKSIDIDEANIILVNDHNLTSLEESFSQNSIIQQIKHLNIKNSKIILKTADSELSSPKANLKINFIDKKKLTVNGALIIEEKEYSVDSTISINSKPYKILSTKLITDGVSISFSGDISNNQDLQITGQTTINLTKPSFITKAIVKTFPAISGGITADKLKDPIDIKGTLSLTDQSLELKDMEISSNKANGNGEIKFSFNKQDELFLNLNFKNVDLNNFLSLEDDIIGNFSSFDSSFNSHTNPKATSFINFKLIDSSNLSINIKADSLMISNIELQNLNANLHTKIGTLKTGGLSFKLKKGDYDTNITLDNLSLTEVEDVPVLVGNFTNSGDNINKTFQLLNMQDIIYINDTNLNYKFNSKIILSSKEISLFEIDGTIGNGKVSGSIASTRDEMNHYNFDLKFNNLKLENFKTPTLQERFYTLLNKSDEENYLSYFRWFRTLSSSYRLKLEFKDSIIKNQNIPSIKTNCKLLPGNMSCKFDLNADFADGAYELSVSANQLKPSLDLKVNSINIDYNKLSSFLALFKSDDKSAIKQSLNETSEDSDQIWSNKKLNIFQITKYNATLDISTQNLILDNFKINNFRLIGHTKNDVFYIDNWYLKIFNGEFQAKGNISFFDTLLYQLSFTTSGLEIKDIIANTFPSLAGIQGPIAATGSIITKGNSLQAIFRNLTVSNSVASPLLKLDGVDADTIVDVATRRKDVNKDKVLGELDKLMRTGNSDLMGINGTFEGKNGIVSTNNLTFKTRFSNGVSAIAIDFNNLTISSNTAFIFTPYSYKGTMDYNIIKSGSLNGNLQRNIDNAKLTKYVKWLYGIVTEEDIAAAKKLAEERARALAIDPDNKDYLYYKLQNKDYDFSKSDSNTNQKPK